MRQIINFVITGVIFVDAESFEEAEHVLEEMSLEEIIDDSEGYTIAYNDISTYKKGEN